MATEVAFKVDVCNHRALHVGLPSLLQTLDRAGVLATIFVAFGPDNSGKAIRRIFRRGFLTKMLRTGAVSLYGPRTLLLGTLLPAPMVGESAKDLLRAAEKSGHPIGLHGFDHVGWQDGVARMDVSALRSSYARAVVRFEETLQHPPRFSGAPGWQVTDLSLAVQEEFGFAWASDTRDGPPFFPLLPTGAVRTLQVPTTLPTSDEVLGSRAARADELARFYDDRLREGELNVVCLHAEAEGLQLAEWLVRWLQVLKVRGVTFVSLPDVVERERERASALRVAGRAIPGRSGLVACPEVAS